MVSISFLYVDFTKLFLARSLLVKANYYPSYIKIPLIPILEVSLLMMKVLEKCSMARTRVEHIVIFNQWKDSYITIEKLKEFFLINAMSGEKNFL